MRRLREPAGDSPYVFAAATSTGYVWRQHFINAMFELGCRSNATVHGFRRTASTVLHEKAYHPDWIELPLAHKIAGVRGIYNAAAYLEQCREMLGWWDGYLAGCRKVDALVAAGAQREGTGAGWCLRRGGLCGNDVASPEVEPAARKVVTLVGMQLGRAPARSPARLAARRHGRRAPGPAPCCHAHWRRSRRGRKAGRCGRPQGGGAPYGKRHGRYRHEMRTEQAIAERRSLAALRQIVRKTLADACLR